MMATHTRENHKSIVPMNMKVDETRRNLIDYAAGLLGQDRTRFVVDAALQHAENVILDRRVFALDDTAFDAFEKVLTEPRPPETEQCLQTFLSRPKRWK